MIIEEDIYLEHFGIRGMRWGVRNRLNSGVDKYKKLGKGSNTKTAAKYAATAYVGYKGARFAGRRLASVGNRVLKRTLLNRLRNEARAASLLTSVGNIAVSNI